MNDPVLECQECGWIIRYLTQEEARLVALDPYKYVVYCRLCKDIMLTRLQDEYWS